MPTTCVLGAQWGDEGKARVVDLLANDADVIVRYQGGANAGHTVIFGGETYRLHLVPSGILRPGKQCLVAHGVVVDLPLLFREVDELVERGVHVGENLMVSSRAHVVMPWHKLLGQVREKVAGARKYGTTGSGIGPCYADKVSYRGIRVADLFEEEWLRERIERNLEEKNRLVVDGYGQAPIRGEAIFDEYRRWAERLAPHVRDGVQFLLDAVDEERSVLFEGAQGVLLDVDLGTYPFVTGSNSCALGVPAGTGLPPKALNTVIGVAKTYVTRVGADLFPTRAEPDMDEALRQAGHEFGTTTGRPRTCGWFDGPMARYSTRSNAIDEMVVTKLDVLRGIERVPICVAYDIDGERTDRIPATAPELARTRPVYEYLPGFTEDITGAREPADLPPNAMAIVRFIEEQCGTRVSMVSVGPSREQIVPLDPVAAERIARPVGAA